MRHLYPFLLFLSLIPYDLFAEVVFDEVVASVDGNPITLKDVSARIPGRPDVRVSELRSKGVAQDALSALVDEALVLAEANDRKISVDDADVNAYLKMVAQQNNLSEAAFQSALHERGIDQAQYRRQVRAEILKSKVAAAVAQTAEGVSDEEVRSVIGESEETAERSEGDVQRVALRQIVIYREGKTPDAFTVRQDEVTTRLLGSETFGDVARALSEGGEAREGGTLGTVQLSDLSEDVQAALEGLQPGQISKPVVSSDGVRFFMVDSGGNVSAQKSIAEEAKAHMKQGKAMQTVDTFFRTTIRDRHVVENYVERAG